MAVAPALLCEGSPAKLGWRLLLGMEAARSRCWSARSAHARALTRIRTRARRPRRFLQGPGTCPQAVQQLREALAEERPRAFTTVLLNYRKADAQGRQEPFWNCLHISPLRDAGGRAGAGCTTFLSV